MLSAEAARNIVGIVGNPTFYRIIKSKAVEEFEPDPYLATVMNCMLWVFYGLPFVHPDSILVVTINSFGLLLELIYLAIFFFYATNRGRKKIVYWLLGEIAFFAVVAVVALLAFHGTKQRSLFVGILCDIFNIIMYSSPLTIMMKVINTKSVEYMPFFLSLTNFLNGSIWTAYALIKFDIYVLVSNLLGVLSGALQLILYGCYYGSTPKKGDINVAIKPSEFQLSARSPV
ncbi:SWEET sugar transporter [Trema orientale]|uniref:SWEET sugar transporter n=1 Tax=Trema orientale TaxID=63057 RepID=A0A2P5B4T5_TREOI|nr:SWEET sugar transporter [Trema orientale]